MVAPQQVLVPPVGIGPATTSPSGGAPAPAGLRVLRLPRILRGDAGRRLQVERVVGASVLAAAHGAGFVRCLTMTTRSRRRLLHHDLVGEAAQQDAEVDVSAGGVRDLVAEPLRAEAAGGDAQRRLIDQADEPEVGEVLGAQRRLEQTVGGEEEVVDVVQRQVETRAQPAQHQAHRG